MKDCAEQDIVRTRHTEASGAKTWLAKPVNRKLCLTQKRGAIALLHTYLSVTESTATASSASLSAALRPTATIALPCIATSESTAA